MKQFVYVSLVTFLLAFFTLPAHAFFGATPTPSHIEASVTPTAKKAEKKTKKVKKKKHKKTKKRPARSHKENDTGTWSGIIALIALMSGSLLLTAGAILSGGALTGMALVGFIVLVVGGVLVLVSFLDEINISLGAFWASLVLGFTMLGIGLNLANPLIWITGAAMAGFIFLIFILAILVLSAKK